MGLWVVLHLISVSNTMNAFLLIGVAMFVPAPMIQPAMQMPPLLHSRANTVPVLGHLNVDVSTTRIALGLMQFARTSAV
jgi:hypothetical protein